MINPHTINSASSKGGYTKSEGGNHSTSVGGNYIKQHHVTQYHPTDAINTTAPHLQQQSVSDPYRL
jgi:hypothetical protein